jgi:Protein of unknown function (DUF2971).
MTPDVGLISIKNRKLRWSSPTRFNDPFDVTQELRLDFDEKIMNLKLREKLINIIETNGSGIGVPYAPMRYMIELIRVGPLEVRNSIIEALRSDSLDPTLGQINSFSMLKEMWKIMVPEFRVLCVSELYDVNSMWQHYASGYSGVVLEFSAVDEVDSAFLMAKPVIYQNNPPRIASPDVWTKMIFGEDGITYRDLFTEYMYVKTKDWEYEKEWRIVSGARPFEKEAYGDYGYHPLELTGVYFGPKCSIDMKNEIQPLLCGDLAHVNIYEPKPDIINAKYKFKRS